MRFGEPRSMSPECAEDIVALDSTLRGIVGRSKERQCSWDTAQSLAIDDSASEKFLAGGDLYLHPTCYFGKIDLPN